MKVQKISLINFRNYEKLELATENMVNILYGDNAQGKTNLLESIYYAAFGLSHRTSSEDDLLNISKDEMAVEVCFNSYFGDHKLKIKRQRIAGKIKKEILLDNNPIKNKEQYGTLNVVMFSPEDLAIVKGEPALRRRFLDMEIAQTNRFYYGVLLKYNRVLQQRNRLLKNTREQGVNKKLFAVWDNELASLASEIITIRLEVLKNISKLAAASYQEITEQKEEMTIQYDLKNNSEKNIAESTSLLLTKEEWQAWYLERFRERFELDLFRGNTGLGPHRDDLIFCVNKKSLKAFGSQGQQRSCALSLKLAEMEYIKSKTGEFPVLLLDDVMSELDSNRRRQLLRFINGKIQTFITVNDRTLIPEFAYNHYFKIVSGKVDEDKNCERY